MKVQKYDIKYKLAQEKDIESIYSIVNTDIVKMESDNIFQWDNLCPTRENFLDNIAKKELFVGIFGDEIAVVYAINKDCDEQYKNGVWRYPDCDYRVIHRFCVNPKYQKRGIAKNALKHIENKLQEDGVETIRLDVFSNNPFALSLYHNSGYKKVGIANWRKGKFFLMEKHV